MKIIIGFIIILFSISLYRCLPPEKIALPGDLTGYVTDAETSEPIQAAAVKLDPSNDTTSTGSDGKFLFKNLESDNYEVEVSKPAYFKDTKNATVTSANTIEIDFALSGAPSIKISDSYLDFGLDSTVKYFTISNAGKGKLEYSLNASKDWITVDPERGDATTETDTIKVTIERAGLSENKHEETVSIISYIGDDIQEDKVDVLVNGVYHEGYYYGIVTIGTQTWMTENLNTGIMISVGLGEEQTNNGKVEKYCYENVPDNCDVYGGLYHFDEMLNYQTDSITQGICPAGWHIPVRSEWYTLFNYFGGKANAGGALKATGTIQDGNGLWEAPNTGATNESGFTGLPGGMFRTLDGWWGKGTEAWFYQNELIFGKLIGLGNASNSIDEQNWTSEGASVRCIKDP